MARVRHARAAAGCLTVRGSAKLSMTAVLNAARSAYAAGLCLLPTRSDGSKSPDVASWKEFQVTRPTPDQMRAFNFASRAGFGIVSGVVSQRRECWDFDTDDVFEAFVAAADACGLRPLLERLTGGYLDMTPGGGRRIIVSYPRDVEARDRTLACRLGKAGEAKVKTLIELPTFAIVAPSSGGTHPSGNPYVRISGAFHTIATYTAEERQALIELAQSFDERTRPEARRPSRRTTVLLGDRPGDDYNRHMTWPEVLEPHGWTRLFDRGETTHWRRPGKTWGQSATTNYGGADLFFPFSSSSEFEAEKSYSKFAVYTVLEHGGDYKRAAAALSDQGYGKPIDRSLQSPQGAQAAPCILADVDAVFRRWLGEDYDLDAMHAVLAAAAAERLAGDPLWLLVVSGPGNAKTETVQALKGIGAIVTSTISSEGALLSASPRHERNKESTGGLLRRIGDRGLLVIKDVTSILSMNRDARASLLAALREVHDGRWERNVGTDGGKSLTWIGRIVLVGAVTTAWDRAHDVISSMGDRFVLIRMDSTTGRLPAGRMACRNTGQEEAMRAELAEAVAGVLRTVDPAQAVNLNDAELERLLEAANVVTLARTGVDYDYRGDVIDSHAPEMPTRFAKQLTQLVRGAIAIGIDRDAALRLALRCARDSMPPLRLAIVDDVASHPGSETKAVRRRLGKPRATVDRQLQSLQILGLLTSKEEDALHRGKPVTIWRYTLAPDIRPSSLDPDSVPEKSPHIHQTENRVREDVPGPPSVTPPDISGTDVSVAVVRWQAELPSDGTCPVPRPADRDEGCSECF